MHSLIVVSLEMSSTSITKMKENNWHNKHLICNKMTFQWLRYCTVLLAHWTTRTKGNPPIFPPEISIMWRGRNFPHWLTNILCTPENIHMISVFCLTYSTSWNSFEICLISVLYLWFSSKLVLILILNIFNDNKKKKIFYSLFRMIHYGLQYFKVFFFETEYRYKF